MGFGDESRNTTILKGLNGNLERTIETLVRLGDGNAPASRPRSPVRPKHVSVSQPFASVGVEPPHAGNGTQMNPSISTESKSEALTLTQAPSSEVRHYNPFEAPSSRSDTWPLEKGLENLQVSQPQPQPLFPNATGGYPIQPDHIQVSRFQQSMTPPVPQLHQHVHSNPFAQQMPTANGNFNPFFQSAQQGAPQFSNPYIPSNQLQANSNPYNPYMAAAQPPLQTYLDGSVGQPHQNHVTLQLPEQQQSFIVNQSQYGHMQNQQQIDHFPQQQQQSVLHPSSQPQQFPHSNPYQHQPLQAQPTARFDKSSILALYNYPQLAPPPNVPSENQAPTPDLPSSGPRATSIPKAMPGQRSVTMPAHLAAGSRNPFLTSSSAQTNNAAAVSSNAAVPAIPSGLSRHVSQESVDVESWQSGRHSPDAFASLSARFVR
ncbi:MAG: hypothetical protein L6R39_000561 [Caloplaca ligustica]|nr:MAG: hypothetical protein L6R39_000561 [Caloplaca ligustica]